MPKYKATAEDLNALYLYTDLYMDELAEVFNIPREDVDDAIEGIDTPPPWSPTFEAKTCVLLWLLDKSNRLLLAVRPSNLVDSKELHAHYSAIADALRNLDVRKD